MTTAPPSSTASPNTNQNPQLSNLTFVDSSHPLDAYSRVVLLNAQGQQGTLLADAGFNIDPTHQFRVAVEENIFSSGKVQYTNLSIEGVKIKSAKEFKPALEHAIRMNKPVVLDVYMKNEPVPTAAHWNIMDIYSQGRKVHHVGTGD